VIDLPLLSAWEVVLEAGFQGLCYLAGGVSRLETPVICFSDGWVDDFVPSHPLMLDAPISTFLMSGAL